MITCVFGSDNKNVTVIMYKTSNPVFGVLQLTGHAHNKQIQVIQSTPALLPRTYSSYIRTYKRSDHPNKI